MRSILGGTRCATSASATRLAVRARGAGAAGQDQVVDELALSNLSDSGSIDQAQIFFARHGRLFLLRLQFMFYRAGRASDEGNCDKKTRGHHYERMCRLRAADAITIFVARWRAGGAARVRRPRGTSSAALARASTLSRSAISAADIADCADFLGFRRMARFSAGVFRSMGNIRHSGADLRGETLTLV